MRRQADSSTLLPEDEICLPAALGIDDVELSASAECFPRRLVTYIETFGDERPDQRLDLLRGRFDDQIDILCRTRTRVIGGGQGPGQHARNVCAIQQADDRGQEAGEAQGCFDRSMPNCVLTKWNTAAARPHAG